MSRGRRTLLAVYPPSFRERYADELDALLDDTGVGRGSRPTWSWERRGHG